MDALAGVKKNVDVVMQKNVLYSITEMDEKILNFQ